MKPVFLLSVLAFGMQCHAAVMLNSDASADAPELVARQRGGGGGGGGGGYGGGGGGRSGGGGGGSRRGSRDRF